MDTLERFHCHFAKEENLLQTKRIFTQYANDQRPYQPVHAQYPIRAFAHTETLGNRGFYW